MGYPMSSCGYIVRLCCNGHPVSQRYLSQIISISRTSLTRSICSTSKLTVLCLTEDMLIDRLVGQGEWLSERLSLSLEQQCLWSRVPASLSKNKSRQDRPSFSTPNIRATNGCTRLVTYSFVTNSYLLSSLTWTKKKEKKKDTKEQNEMILSNTCQA